jgi:hypothetical protein
MQENPRGGHSCLPPTVGVVSGCLWPALIPFMISSLSLSIHIVVHLMLSSWNTSAILLGMMLMSRRSFLLTADGGGCLWLLVACAHTLECIWVPFLSFFSLSLHPHCGPLDAFFLEYLRNTPRNDADVYEINHECRKTLEAVILAYRRRWGLSLVACGLRSYSGV